MFSFKKTNTEPVVPVIKTLPVKASTSYKVGDALVLSDGVLNKATGTTAPQYIAAKNYDAPATDGEDLPVYLVVSGHEYETTFSADATAVAEGSKVTLATDAAQVTATTTNGVATIVKKHGAGAAGTAVTVRF
jgi:hypothetical protein